MKYKDELKEIVIKNCTCYYFDVIIKDVDIYFSDILLDEKLYKNIWIFDISYKTSTGPKSLCITIDKIDGFIRVSGGEFRHLVLLDNELFDKFFDKIKHLIRKKGGIIDSIYHNFGKIRIDSYNSFPIEKIMTFHNVIILIKSVVKNNKNEHYNNIFFKRFL